MGGVGWWGSWGLGLGIQEWWGQDLGVWGSMVLIYLPIVNEHMLDLDIG